MVEIFEDRASALPNYTSLFFKSSYVTREIREVLQQQELYNLDILTGLYEFPTNRLFFLIMLFNKYDDVSFKPYKEPYIEQKELSQYNFKANLFSHQKEAVLYGLSHNGWMLLDTMGLGKTISAICLAEALKQEYGIKHCLIICGVNGLKYNWASEIKKFSNLSYTILGQTTTSRGKQVIGTLEERWKALQKNIDEFFVITNIETLYGETKKVIKNGKLTKKHTDKFADAFKKSVNEFGMIILDEAHKCCNPDSYSVKSLLKLQSPHNLAMTGTPIMNNPDNAYVLLKWTGNIKCNFSTFKKMYNVYGGFDNKEVIGHKNLELLQEHISKCSLRRKKEGIIDLPPKTYKIEYVEMGKAQRDLYNQVEDGILKELDLLPKESLTVKQEIAINIRLRQITAFPGIINTKVTESAKLDRLEELVDTIVNQGDKVVVFSTFKQTIPEVCRRLEQYSPIVCTGDENDRKINENKDKFQNDPNSKVFIATWSKMGTGHTLNAANYVIFIDTPWTDAVFQQSADRIHRIGQTQKCTIITLIAKDTYDERVQEILENKEILSNYLVDGVNSNKLTQLMDLETFCIE